MNYVLFILGILLSVLTVQLWYMGYQNNTNHTNYIRNNNDQFEKWTNEKGIRYRTESEKDYRRKIFEANQKSINELQKKHKDTKFDLNHFSDLTHEEFKEKYLGLKFQEIDKSLSTSLENQSLYAELETDFNRSLIKKEVDWRTSTQYFIKNQQQCGSCWAFSTSAVLEYKAALNISLSPQNLVDCDTQNNGCGGGWFRGSYGYLVQKGLHRESDYPYKAIKGTCNDAVNNDKIKPRKFIYYEKFNLPECDYLKFLVSNFGATSVAVLVGGQNQWMHYSGGIIYESETFEERKLKSDVDHAVVVVGYKDDYWIIQNSWGNQWGEAGFAKIQSGNAFNICVAGYAISTTTQQIQDDYKNNSNKTFS